MTTVTPILKKRVWRTPATEKAVKKMMVALDQAQDAMSKAEHSFTSNGELKQVWFDWFLGVGDMWRQCKALIEFWDAEDKELKAFQPGEQVLAVRFDCRTERRMAA